MTEDKELTAEPEDIWALDSMYKTARQWNNFIVARCNLSVYFVCAGGSSSNEEEEPTKKKKRDQLLYMQSEEFQKILNAKSRHAVVLQAVWKKSLCYMHLLRLVFSQPI